MSGRPSETSPLSELRLILRSEKETSAEEALLNLVRNRPAVLVDVLFPVILPAIRRSISTLFQAMIEELNRRLAKNFSFRSLRWRLEALRTRRSYAEVALLRSVQFEVMDVFLVHRQSGLLILHAAAQKAHVQDAASVSSLLSAIQDYVRESFRLSDNQELNRLEIGDYSMWIEQGPRALIAARTHGPMPQSFAERLQSVVEVIHHERSTELAAFVGDSTPFKPYQALLENLLHMDFENLVPTPKYRRIGYALLVLPLLLLAAWMTWLVYKIHEKDLLVRQLNATPGVLVTESFRSNGKIVMSGFRDPLSKVDHDPEKVELRFRPYLSMDPTIASRRAARILSSPPGVEVGLDDDSMLVLSGVAPYAWLKKVRQEYLHVPGAMGLREEGFQSTEELELQARRVQLEGQRIYFARGSSTISSENNEILPLLISELRHLAILAERSDRILIVDVVGDVDSSGSDRVNEFLGPERALVVAERLRSYGISANVAPSPPLPSMSTIAPLDFLRRQVALKIRSEEYPWSGDERRMYTLTY